jgi:hypothetical protein
MKKEKKIEKKKKTGEKRILSPIGSSCVSFEHSTNY